MPSTDGSGFRRMLAAGLTWLDRHHEIVNALNVFPVPDGDTGTNMLLTMKSALNEIQGGAATSLGDVARAAAHGALMGARGNSGVILSQILRGMARKLDGAQTLDGNLMAASLVEASKVAYKGVNRPVEGTILTVVREASAAAEATAGATNDLSAVLQSTLVAAEDSLARTPTLLPVLAQAGKVDSGGKGLVYILQGMLQALLGQELAPETAETAAPVPSAGARRPKGRGQLPAPVYGFDVQFLVEGTDLDTEAIRARIVAMGDCPLVEGDGGLVKVHVHVPDPGVVLTYAVQLGFVTDVVVENMDDMSLPDLPQGADPVPPRFAETPFETGALVAGDTAIESGLADGPGIVAVAPGEGLAQVFRSLGAHRVVRGGQTKNPSTQELLEAIAAVQREEVIILPNNSNVIMTAQQAQALASKPVAVIASKSVPQGISALLALNAHGDLAYNERVMSSALGNVLTGEVTVAVHAAEFDGIHVEAGDVIGLLDDRLTTTGADDQAVVRNLLDQMHASDLEIITLYFGEKVTTEEAAVLRDVLRDIYTEQDIEIVDGGQPFYSYIISAE